MSKSLRFIILREILTQGKSYKIPESERIHNALHQILICFICSGGYFRATFSVTPAIKEEPQKKPITASKQCRGDEKVAPTHVETAPILTENHPVNKTEAPFRLLNAQNLTGNLIFALPLPHYICCMKLPKYELTAEKSLMVFEFASVGTKGRIPKLIKFSETHLKDFFNLAFGDKSLDTGEIDDLSVSNNGDSERVLATVVSAVYAFTDKYREAWVYASGSTQGRTRLYRMGISKYLEDVTKDFEVYGLFENEWYDFVNGKDFDAFVVRRLKK